MCSHHLFAPRADHRSAFTMLELLVVVAILGILLALLLPAVQQVRTTSCRIQCTNNLRQIGIAMHNFQEQKGYYPGANAAKELLPFLDQQVQAEQIPGNYEYGDLETIGAAAPFDLSSVGVYGCPDDPAQSIARNRATNYHLNIGSGFWDPGGSHYDGGGFFRSDPMLMPRDIVDGLSQTAAFSERLLYRGNREAGVPDDEDVPFTPTMDQKRRRMALTDAYYLRDQLDSFARVCENDATWFGGMAGYICTWLSSGCAMFSYNHVVTPNRNSCHNGVPTYLGDWRFRSFAAMTASSMHPGGVHVLTGDGAVRFIADSIDRSIWHGLGTRAGNDTDAGVAF